MKKPIIVETPDLFALRKICQEYIDAVATREYVDEDLSHYIFECALSTFFGKDVWNFVNNREEVSEEN